MASEQPVSAAAGYFTGEDKRILFTIYQADETTPQDISGWVLSWMVKRRKTDADDDAIITKTTSGGGIALTTPVSGVCTVTLTDTDIESIRGEYLYFHELKRTDAGFETVLSYGQFMLNQAVHQ